MSRRDGPHEGPPGPGSPRPAARPPGLSAECRRAVCDARLRRPLVHAVARGAGRVRRFEAGAGHGGREREALQGRGDRDGSRLSVLALRSRPRDVLARRPIPAIDGGGIHLRLGTPGADLGRRRGEHAGEDREGHEEVEIGMAITVDPKGSGGAAPPAYVTTPAWRFLSSLPVDRKLARYDVAGRIAHGKMLAAVGVLTGPEAGAPSLRLRPIPGEILSRRFALMEDLQDVHTNIEARLTEHLRPPAAQMHTR